MVWFSKGWPLPTNRRTNINSAFINYPACYKLGGIKITIMTFEQFYKEVTVESKVEATRAYVRILWNNAYTIDQAIHNLKTMHEG